jgi:hypothetical protein
MIALDEIGFIGNPRARNTVKKQRMTSAYFQASRKMWNEEGRNLTEEEKNKVIREAELAYNREVRHRRKSSVTLSPNS